tara:strand:+ start:1971 stop:2363 length:393 start_codon:yes stop_codon:yes gene_type:complete
MASNDPKDIDNYISGFPEAIQEKLNAIRRTIKLAVPEAQEVMSYGMPAYKYHGMLVYFAAHQNHIGLYPYPSAMAKYEAELANYKTSKSTIQFPLNHDLPIDLIGKIVLFRVQENEAKAMAKEAAKKAKK